jgi:hypothetical protein
MADRSVHYEAAFEAYLREQGIPYVAVDEAKRALFANAKLKSFDFVVYSKNGPNLLIDIKGRSALGKGSRQNWATEQDVEDLAEWQRVFGDGFTALFGFVYQIDPPLTPEPHMYCHRDRWYELFAVALDEYRNHMRRRSEKWQTVCLPAQDFRELARPIGSWL